MHELAIAERLLDRALAAAADHGADRIEALTVELGTATHLVTDQVRFCIETVAEGTAADGATVRFDRVAARGECDCGWHGELPTLAAAQLAPDRRCPDCGAGVELTAGDECRLAAIDVP
jgi:hydrogenase nickel incorporation protein HypA/HybF